MKTRSLRSNKTCCLIIVLIIWVWLQCTLNSNSNLTREKATPLPTTRLRPFLKSFLSRDVLVAGYFDNAFGLAEAGRLMATAVQAAGFNVNYYSFALSSHWSNKDALTYHLCSKPSQINIINVNAMEIQRNMDMAPHLFRPSANHRPINIAVWYWELEQFPIQKFGDCTRDISAIWVTSTFTLDSIAPTVRLPVQKVTLPLQRKNIGDRNWRRELGLRPSTVVFLYNFDYHSTVDRKNPDGVVEAFNMAFDDAADAALVLKSSHWSLGPQTQQHWSALNALRMPNLYLIGDNLAREDVMALYGAVDCFVSLHRAEGLGLGMMTSMLLGKPVIATNYSGNVDFTHSDNSFLVGYKRVGIKNDAGLYTTSQQWAEPDLHQAARHMRYVYENRAASAAVGRRGSRFIHNHYSLAASSRSVRSKIISVYRLSKNQHFPSENIKY